MFPEHVPAHDEQVGSSCRDLQALAQADAAYSKVELECHPKKRLRRADNFKAWGAHFDGNACLVGMDGTKLAMLSFLTALLAQKGVVSERLLQKVLGLWASALQFKRPLFSLLQAAYHVGHPEGCPVSPFRMPRTLQVELWMLSVLGPLSITNLKAQVSSLVYAADASWLALYVPTWVSRLLQSCSAAPIIEASTQDCYPPQVLPFKSAVLSLRNL